MCAESSRTDQQKMYDGPPDPDYLDKSRPLVERLRQEGECWPADEHTYDEIDHARLYNEAADEIERLRGVLLEAFNGNPKAVIWAELWPGHTDECRRYADGRFCCPPGCEGVTS